jgi:DNA-binding NtrC family response regulator
MSSRDSSTNLAARTPAVAPGLSGRRVLLVEDSPVVGPFTADLLSDLGCEVVGPAPNMAAAREFVENEEIDVAVLDVHIRGERVFPLLDVLEDKRVPFLLTSGYADWQMPDKWQDRPRLQKPYTYGQVETALSELLCIAAD